MSLPAIVLLLSASVGCGAAATAAKSMAVEQAGALEATTADLAQQVWNHSELAFQEFRSSKLLADTLEQNGFRVERGVAGMKTAFVAQFGQGRPVIAILAEFDALPGLSQSAVTHREPVPSRSAGHGCGHNLFGAASVSAAIAVKRVLDQQHLQGIIRVYGCPAEEGGGGKTYMVRDGLFRDVDAALHWHPGTDNDARMRSCLAVIRFRARFKGKAAHASGSPHKGRSALDGVELMNIGVNFLREHIPSQARIHYVITDGGRRPNVVPENAEAWYYIRAPRMDEARAIFERVQKIAQGAALMSETEFELHSISGTYELLVNEPLAKLVDANLRWIGPPKFDADEVAFAEQLRQTLGLANDVDLEGGASGPVDQTIRRFGTSLGLGSTDVGDVSWVVPTAGFSVATAARGIPGHSWSFVACSGAPLGRRGAVVAAKILAASAIDLLENPEVLRQARADFEQRRAAVAYQSPIGDRPPPDRLDEVPDSAGSSD